MRLFNLFINITVTCFVVASLGGGLWWLLSPVVLVLVGLCLSMVGIVTGLLLGGLVHVLKGGR